MLTMSHMTHLHLQNCEKQVLHFFSFFKDLCTVITWYPIVIDIFSATKAESPGQLFLQHYLRYDVQ